MELYIVAAVHPEITESSIRLKNLRMNKWGGYSSVLGMQEVLGSIPIPPIKKNLVTFPAKKKKEE